MSDVQVVPLRFDAPCRCSANRLARRGRQRTEAMQERIAGSQNEFAGRPLITC
jgi:ribose 1,5-bisphosphokinase PhnN